MLDAAVTRRRGRAAPSPSRYRTSARLSASNKFVTSLRTASARAVSKSRPAEYDQARPRLRRFTRPLPHMRSSTVMTVLDSMCGKGLVKRRKRGRAWSYTAALDLEAARSEAVRRLVANLFESDSRALVRYLLGDGAARPRRRVAAASSIDDELL